MTLFLLVAYLWCWPPVCGRGSVHVCIYVGTHEYTVYAHMCALLWWPDVDIKCLPHFLSTLPTEEGSSLNLELTDLASINSLLDLGNSYLLLPNTRTTDGHYATQLLHRFWGSVLHPHCCPVDTFPMELPHSPCQQVCWCWTTVYILSIIF